MIGRIKKLLVKELRNIANNIEADNSHLSEAEAIDLFSFVCHQALCAEEVCEYLNISRPTLTNYIHDGFIPKGRKLKGRKELIWYKDELINVINR